jgi:hypothetical protein
MISIGTLFHKVCREDLNSCMICAAEMENLACNMPPPAVFKYRGNLNALLFGKLTREHFMCVTTRALLFADFVTVYRSALRKRDMA